MQAPGAAFTRTAGKLLITGLPCTSSAGTARLVSIEYPGGVHVRWGALITRRVTPSPVPCSCGIKPATRNRSRPSKTALSPPVFHCCRAFYLITTPGTVVKGILSDPSILERTYIYTGQPVNVTGYLNTTANPVGEPPTIKVVSIVPLNKRQPAQPRISRKLAPAHASWGRARYKAQAS